MKILVLNGPNLNLLGTREPTTYGAVTLSEIEERLVALAKSLDSELSCYQSNSESDLITKIHQAPANHIDFMIINPAAFTHTSIAIRDAIAAVGLAFFEVHLSNIHQREAFRQHSYFSDIAKGVICGFGAHGYEMALIAAHQMYQATD